MFRVRAGDKRPLIKGWQVEATSDAARVAWLWRAAPRANIGVATGRVLWALDVDGEAGLRSLEVLETRHGKLPITVTSITGAGGRHLLFAMPPGRTIRNSAGRLGPGLDVRGAGGFIVAPPSIHPNGRRYQWKPGRSPCDVSLASAPPWLLELVDPTRRAEPVPHAAEHAGSSRYASAALARAVERVASAPPGSRNDALNRETFSLSRFIDAGSLDPSALATSLASAGLAAGLPAAEVSRTIASALRARLGGGHV